MRLFLVTLDRKRRTVAQFSLFRREHGIGYDKITKKWTVVPSAVTKLDKLCLTSPQTYADKWSGVKKAKNDLSLIKRRQHLNRRPRK